MDVEAVSEVVLRNLTDLLDQNSIASDQIKGIREQLPKMRGYPNDGEWATKYLRLLFSVEDEMEKHVLSLCASGFFQRRGKMPRRGLDRLAAEIKSLEDKLPAGQVVEQQNWGRAGEQLHLQAQLNVSLARIKRSKSFSGGGGGGGGHLIRQLSFTSTNPDQEGPSLIGFTTDQITLVGRLMEGGGGVIPIVGRAGCGKTTLVRRIYNLRKINQHFNCLAWVHAVDKSITKPKLLANLLKQVLQSKEGLGLIPNTHQQLISKVRDSLKDKTYLVVLDHVRDIQFWNDLKPAFPNLATGYSKSKVILLISDTNVGTSISQQQNCKIHHLSQLSDELSWELFTKKSRLGQESAIDIGFKDQILQKCEGCPLNILLLGGLLSTKGPHFEDWKSYLTQLNWHGVKIWQLSYNDLPSHSKLCLLYMALFPNDLDIPVRRLHWLWLAEGFIMPSPEMSEEDAVDECFKNLLQRNFIKVTKFRSDGSPKRCRLPDALHEDLSEIARRINLFCIHQGHVATPKLDIRRLIEYVDIKNETSSASSDSSSLSYKCVRSYISFNSKRNDTPAKEVGNFISKMIGKKGFGVLRVLDLEGVYKPTLPETLKLLFHLRYLGLRWTFTEHLPKSVGELPYLETLDLKRTYINSLPSSIWKLAHLRHLNLPGIRLDYKHSCLTELRTLEGLIVDDETNVKEQLSNLLQLRELGITCQLSSSSDLISWIQKLTNLRFLWLKSKDEMGQPSKINLESLAKLSRLSRVNLLGHLKKLPDSPFPPNLKVLALSVSRLKDDPMPVLSKLPSLSVLRLLADSYLGTTMKCPKDGFKNLQVLKLWMLKELADWTMEEASMPLLKQLNIRYCNSLKQLPSQLLDQATLEKLILTSMPKGFGEQVRQRLQNIQRPPALDLNHYKFTPLPWENDPDLWELP